MSRDGHDYLRSNHEYPVADLLACMTYEGTTDLARQLGVTRRTATRLTRSGATLRTGRADELAVRAGFHPAEVWPAWVDNALSDAEVRRIARIAAKAILELDAADAQLSLEGVS